MRKLQGQHDMTTGDKVWGEMAPAPDAPKFPGPLSTRDWRGNDYMDVSNALASWGARFPSKPDIPFSTLNERPRLVLLERYRNYVCDGVFKRVMEWAVGRECEGNINRALWAWREHFNTDAWGDGESRLNWFMRWVGE